MAASKRGELPKDLAQGRSQFQAWRASRKRGRRIPQTLCNPAIRLVETHGLCRTATALGLDYYRLKKQAEKTADQPHLSSPAFVELPSPVAVGKQGVCELDNEAGTRMRVQLMAYDGNNCPQKVPPLSAPRTLSPAQQTLRFRASREILPSDALRMHGDDVQTSLTGAANLSPTHAG